MRINVVIHTEIYKHLPKWALDYLYGRGRM